MEYSIANAGVKMVEYGWIELEVEHDGETHTIEFETAEVPMGTQGAEFISVEFADSDSEDIANKIGLIINDEFCGELFHMWDTYSNSHFR